MSTSPTFTLTPDNAGRSLAQEWLEEARQSGQSDAYTRQHQDPRFTWYSQLEVHVLGPAGRTATFYADACDISEGGIGFRCRQQIPPFTDIQVCVAGEMTGVSAL